MNDIESNQAYTTVAKTDRRFEICNQRLLSEHGIDRGVSACKAHWWALTQKGKSKDDIATDTPTPTDATELYEVSDTVRKSDFWTAEHEEAMMKLLDEIDADPAYARMHKGQRREVCSQRMKSGYGFDRTANAIKRRSHLIGIKRKRHDESDGDGDGSGDEEEEGEDDVAIANVFRRKRRLAQPGSRGPSLSELFADEEI